MAIINDKELLKDSLEILTNHFEIPEPDAKKILTEDNMANIVNEMYKQQEYIISEIAMKHQQGNKWQK